MNGKDLLEKMKRNDLVMSMSLRLGMGNPAVEIAHKAGFDFLYVDFEHGVVDMETFAHIVKEARMYNLIVLCRAPSLDVGFVNRALDAGASGVVFPHIISRKDAEKAVELVKFRTKDLPQGRRGFEPAYGLPKLDNEEWNDYFCRVNHETLVGLMIEDREGVENIEDIVTVKGVDMIYIGKMDMAFSYGVPFTPLSGSDDPVIEKAVKKICNASKEKGIPVRFTVGKMPYEIILNVKRWIPEGRSKLFMVTDNELLTYSAKEYTRKLNEGLKEK